MHVFSGLNHKGLCTFVLSSLQYYILPWNGIQRLYTDATYSTHVGRDGMEYRDYIQTLHTVLTWAVVRCGREGES